MKGHGFLVISLHFETDSAVLKPNSLEQLKNIAAILIAYPNVVIMLGGYTDSLGSSEDDLVLSKARAESVYHALIALGVNDKQLQTAGFGQEHPIASNDTDQGREKNRRVDLRVIGK